MPRTLGELEELSPFEKRIALMRVAGAAHSTIAEMLETSTANIGNVLSRPRVARFILHLHGAVSDELREGVADLNEAFKKKAERAFELEAAEMEALHQLGEDSDVKISTRVRAKMGVVFTAKDILDRAGHRAPTKVYNYGASGNIPPEAAEALVQATRELVQIRRAEREMIDVTPDGTDSNT